MPDVRRSRARRRAERLRRQRRRAILIAAGALALAAIALALILPSLGRRDDVTMTPKAAPEAASEIASEASATKVPAAEVPNDAESPAAEVSNDMEASAATEVPAAETPVPTPEPTPERTPQPTPEGMPDVVAFYQPKDKSYSPRVRLGDEYPAKWKKGEDIGSFEVIASDAQELEGSFFGDIFGAAWKAFPGAAGCKIGYTLRYALDDGSEIKYTMLSPKHIEHTEYIECWLYDDYHREPHTFYSHLKSVKNDTLMTSIKLTCGRQIEHVREIWLTTFICSSLDDFDADRNYTGDVSRTIHITRQ